MNDKMFTPFASNIKKLAGHRKLSINAWCLQYPNAGIDQSTMSRILRGVQDPTLETVNRVAVATGYAEWQLLHPDFEPALEPPMLDEEVRRVAYVFSTIKDPLDRRRARAIIEQFEDVAAPAPASSSPAQQPGTGKPSEESPTPPPATHAPASMAVKRGKQSKPQAQ